MGAAAGTLARYFMPPCRTSNHKCPLPACCSSASCLHQHKKCKWPLTTRRRQQAGWSLTKGCVPLQWVQGRQQGYGKQIFANGTMCLGSFGRTGRLDGFGVCLYPSGDSYEGQVSLDPTRQ